MKKLLILLLFVSTVKAQSPLAAAYFKEAEAAAQDQRLWNAHLYGPMLFVDPQTRLTYANQPDSTHLFKSENGIYVGKLPSTVMIANTAIHWQGKTWSCLLWPLPTDRNERINLVLHENFHRIQESIGFYGHSPTADHLSTMAGRTYFLLELNALKAALQKPVRQRNPDLSQALAFREKRRVLFPKTFGNERVLEMNEGLAEFTGAYLGRQDLRSHLYQQVDTAGNRGSLIRSFAYLTGPLYGLLLQEKNSKWTQTLDSTADFPELIRKYYQVTITTANESRYSGTAIRASEQQKENTRLEKAAAYIKQFTREPVLQIDLVKMNIVFNPNTLFDLGDYGTVYPTGEIQDVWGKLKVSGGFLLKDWKVVSVPLTGDTYTLELATGWEKIKLDNLHYTLRKIK